MQESWFCAQCKSMNRANAQQCYKCRALKAGATLATIAGRQHGVVLTPGLDEEHREVAWTLMFRQTYVSAWKIGYLAAALLFAMLAVWLLIGAVTLVSVIHLFSTDQADLGNQSHAPLLSLFAAGLIGAGLLAIVTVVVHSVFLYLTSVNASALGSGSPRFDPARAALWWIESALWAIRGSLAFVVPPFLALIAVSLVGPILGMGLGIVWFVCAFWALGDPVSCLDKPRRLLVDLWDRLGIPGSADSRIVTLWSVAWGTGRGIEYAVSGVIYLFVIVLSIIGFGASRIGGEVTFAPAGQVALAQTLLTFTVLTVQIVADGIGLYLLARITMELATRQRVREGWVLGGLDVARMKASEEATTREAAARSSAGAGVAPWTPQPPLPVETLPAVPQPGAEAEAGPRPRPAGPPPAVPKPQEWQGTVQWPPAPKPDQPPSTPARPPFQPPEASQLQPTGLWPEMQPPPPEEDASTTASTDVAKPVIRPSSAGTPRYRSVQGDHLGSPPSASSESSAGDGSSGSIPDDPSLGEGI